MAALMRRVNEPIPPAIRARPDVDPALSAWTDRLLAKKRRDRPQSAALAWSELEEAVVAQLGPWWRCDARLPARSPALSPGAPPDIRSPRVTCGSQVTLAAPPDPRRDELTESLRPAHGRTSRALAGGLVAIAVAVTIATSAVFLTGAHGSPPPTSNTGTGTSTTATTGTTTTTSRSLPTAIANDGWSGTAGPLTVTVTHLARIGTSLELKLEAQTTSALTLPFYGSFAATSPSGQTFTFAASKDPLQLIPGTAVAATVQLSGVDPLPAKLTVAFSHIYPTDPNELPAVSNGLLVHDIPIPQ